MRTNTLVRFTATLGLMRTIEDTKFVEETVKPGDTGLYLGPHPIPTMGNWHVVAVRRDGVLLVCPCGADQFEVV